MDNLKRKQLTSDNEDDSMLYFRDDLRKIWLYQANCLELMDIT
jgi:hypothetical protein